VILDQCLTRHAVLGAGPVVSARLDDQVARDPSCLRAEICMGEQAADAREIVAIEASRMAEDRVLDRLAASQAPDRPCDGGCAFSTSPP